MSGLQVRIVKRFPSSSLIDIDFATDAGFIVLFGRSGAGKTVTLSSIAGLESPDHGRIMVDGETFLDTDARIDLPTQKRGIGYVFQSFALFPHLTVRQNIDLALRWGRRPDGRAPERAPELTPERALTGLTLPVRDAANGPENDALWMDELLSELGIADLVDRKPGQLSGGQRQRAAIARALACRPSLLLMDEPFSALDAPVRDRLRSLVKSIQRKYGLRVILITHLPYEAYNLADEIVVLEDGRVTQMGAPEDVFYRPSALSVARLVGSKNIFSGRVVASGNAIESSGRIFETGASIDRFAPGTQVDWCIRPESIMVLRSNKPLKSAVKENVLDGVILEAERHGPSWEYLFVTGSSDATPDGVSTLNAEPGTDLPQMRLKLQVPAHASAMLGLQEGSSISVSLKREEIHVIGPTAIQ